MNCPHMSMHGHCQTCGHG